MTAMHDFDSFSLSPPNKTSIAACIMVAVPNTVVQILFDVIGGYVAIAIAQQANASLGGLEY